MKILLDLKRGQLCYFDNVNASFCDVIIIHKASINGMDQSVVPINGIDQSMAPINQWHQSVNDTSESGTNQWHQSSSGTNQAVAPETDSQ